MAKVSTDDKSRKRYRNDLAEDLCGKCDCILDSNNQYTTCNNCTIKFCRECTKISKALYDCDKGGET